MRKEQEGIRQENCVKARQLCIRRQFSGIFFFHKTDVSVYRSTYVCTSYVIRFYILIYTLYIIIYLCITFILYLNFFCY